MQEQPHQRQSEMGLVEEAHSQPFQTISTQRPARTCERHLFDQVISWRTSSTFSGGMPVHFAWLCKFCESIRNPIGLMRCFRVSEKSSEDPLDYLLNLLVNFKEPIFQSLKEITDVPLSNYREAQPSIRPTVSPSDRPFVRPSIHPSRPPVRPPVGLSVCLSVRPTALLSIWPSRPQTTKKPGKRVTNQRKSASEQLFGCIETCIWVEISIQMQW